MEFSQNVQKLYETVKIMDPLFVGRNSFEIIVRARELGIEVIRDGTGNIKEHRVVVLGRNKRPDAERSKQVLK